MASVSEARPAARGLPVVAIVGRPNVGKSTLFNRLVGAHRAIVDDAPGVTRDRVVAPAVHAGRAFLCVDTGGFAAEPPRDPAALAARVRAQTLAAVAEAACVVCALDTPLVVAGRPYVLIDTAGIRRRGKVREPLERHGAVRALGTLARADLVLVVLDAVEGMTDQDARLVGRAWQAGRGVVLLANKWDLVPPGRRDRAAFRAALVAAHPAFAELPLLCVSAVTGEALGDLFPLVARVERAYEAELPTPALNRALAAAVAATPPPSPGGKALRFFYAAQTGRRPPAVAVFASAPALVPAAYARYLVGRLAQAFRLTGVPLHLVLRTRRTPGAPHARGRATRGRSRRPPRRRGAAPRPR